MCCGRNRWLLAGIAVVSFALLPPSFAVIAFAVIAFALRPPSFAVIAFAVIAFALLAPSFAVRACSPWWLLHKAAALLFPSGLP